MATGNSAKVWGPLLVFLLANPGFGQEIRITGKVSGPGGEKIANASLALIGQPLRAVTDANGDYAIAGAAALFGNPGSGQHTGRVDLYNPAGRWTVPPRGRPGAAILFPLRSRSGGKAGLGKMSAIAVDSLEVKAAGHITKTVPVESYISTVNVTLEAQVRDAALAYPAYARKDSDLRISRSAYHDGLAGFWLGECIANWTGLITEFDRVGMPRTPAFYTDANWGGPDSPTMWGGRHPSPTITYYFYSETTPWGADDDTDLEYMYQHLLDKADTSVLSGRQIRDGWLNHIYDQNQPTPFGKDEDPAGGWQNYLWVSNQRAFDLMRDSAMVPPQTSLPAHNPEFAMIDAQLTTEIFGVLAPARVDVAHRMAYLPIRTTAYAESESIARFYVTMHSLATVALHHPDHKSKTMKERLLWMADQAYRQLPTDTYPRKMYDFVKASYDANPDKSDWEKTRDAVYLRYQGNNNSVKGADGYVYSGSGNAMSNVGAADAGINFASSLVSLFYGEGDLLRTVRIGTLAGWDSDNPTATWGGLLGFMLGRQAVEAACKSFTSKKLAENFWIHRTRKNFPDYTPASEGEDAFALMAKRGIFIIDRVVLEEMGGGVDPAADAWYIPAASGGF